MNRPRRVLAVLVAAAVAAAVTLTGQEANAADPWPDRFRCASGGFDLTSVTSALTEQGQPGQISVSVDGALTCLYTESGATFALAYYPAGTRYAYIHPRYGFRPYVTKSDRHPFTAVGSVMPGQPVTICAMSDVDLRAACIKVQDNRAGRPGTVLVNVVSPSDKSLDLPVHYIDNTVDPGCGGCWSVKP